MLESGLPLSQLDCSPCEPGSPPWDREKSTLPYHPVDEETWQPNAQSPAKGLTKGWLIERIDFLGTEQADCDSNRRFLQIGTGQWCGAPYATLFPMRRTAIAYTREFGLAVDRKVRIVAYTAP